MAADPVTIGLLAGGGGIASGIGSIFGANKTAKAIKKAMEMYLNYLNQQRNLFLSQPETGTIRSTLGRWAKGDVGFDPQALEGIRSGLYDDYGRSLGELQRLYGQAGVQPGSGGGVYRPGAQQRTMRLYGQQLAHQRAQSLRDLALQDAQQRIANTQFAISALPTYMPGLPATPVASPSVFQGLTTPGVGFGQGLFSTLGSGIQSGLNAYLQAGQMGTLNQLQPMLQELLIRLGGSGIIGGGGSTGRP